ncbi:hypothetical protein ACYEXS_35230 [Paenibacillus sp. MAH-36]
MKNDKNVFRYNKKAAILADINRTILLSLDNIFHVIDHVVAGNIGCLQ